MKTRLSFLGVLALTVALAACGGEEQVPAPTGGDQPSAQEQPASTDTVNIEDFKYSPPTATVKPGTKITWRNIDTAPHTATSVEEGLFDTGNIEQNKSGSATAPDEPGSYEYICAIHPSMKGTLVVE